MFGDSGRLAATEDWEPCAPAVATDIAVAAVAVFRKFLRSMKTSLQELLIPIDASEKSENAEGIRRTRNKSLPIRSPKNQFKLRELPSPRRRLPAVRRRWWPKKARWQHRSPLPQLHPRWQSA